MDGYTRAEIREKLIRKGIEPDAPRDPRRDKRNDVLFHLAGILYWIILIGALIVGLRA